MLQPAGPQQCHLAYPLLLTTSSSSTLCPALSVPTLVPQQQLHCTGTVYRRAEERGGEERGERREGRAAVERGETPVERRENGKNRQMGVSVAVCSVIAAQYWSARVPPPGRYYVKNSVPALILFEIIACVFCINLFSPLSRSLAAAEGIRRLLLLLLPLLLPATGRCCCVVVVCLLLLLRGTVWWCCCCLLLLSVYCRVGFAAARYYCSFPSSAALLLPSQQLQLAPAVHLPCGRLATWQATAAVEAAGVVEVEVAMVGGTMAAPSGRHC